MDEPCDVCGGDGTCCGSNDYGCTNVCPICEGSGLRRDSPYYGWDRDANGKPLDPSGPPAMVPSMNFTFTRTQRQYVRALMGRADCWFERYPIGWRAHTLGVVVYGPWRPTAAWAERAARRRCANEAIRQEIEDDR